MAGYLVLPETACVSEGSPRTKVALNPIRLGLFDLLREFEQDPFPFNRSGPGVCLLCLDEFLAQMRITEALGENRDWPFLTQVKRRLKTVANDVSNMGIIHVPIRRELDLGGDNRLYARSGPRRIPLWRLFGSNPAIRMVDGFAAYEYGENLP
mgnify:CR=1 FL=1